MPRRDQQLFLTSPLAPQGMPIQLHTPYSPEHAKVPIGSITMGLPLAMDPKKLGKELGDELFLTCSESSRERACQQHRGKEEHRAQQGSTQRTAKRMKGLVHQESRDTGS